MVYLLSQRLWNSIFSCFWLHNRYNYLLQVWNTVPTWVYKHTCETMAMMNAQLGTAKKEKCAYWIKKITVLVWARHRNQLLKKKNLLLLLSSVFLCHSEELTLVYCNDIFRWKCTKEIKTLCNFYLKQIT